ncbi:hypothetical protein BVRB_2g032130 [Beta vulgaris subsp. vulgaris]|nr:hypothetical protein BVRB_2g032130 [Beta vulgaris subsp. vulgaris]
MKSSKRQKSRKTRKTKTKCLNELSMSYPVQLCMNAMNDEEKLQKKTGDFGKKVGNACMEDLQQTQVEVCDVCGDNGFSNALIYCSTCSDTAVHQYCLGISPGSIDDTYNWFCEYCCPSMEFEHLDTSGATCIRTEECFEELAVPLELQSEQCLLNGIIVDEVEPLCTLLPLLPHGSSEHMETHDQCQIAEVNSRMATTIITHSANHREEHEPSVSSFMESPKEIMSGLVLLASASGKIIIFGSMSISTVNITGSCNEMNRDILVVGDECAVQETAELGDVSSRMNKEIDAGYSNEDASFCKGAVDACPENTSEDTNVREVIDMGLPAIGNGSLHWVKRKRTETIAICDLIPSIGSECKRARSKRCKISPSLSKEVDACKLTITDVCTTGEERSDQPVNGHEVITVGKILHGTSQPQTLNTSPLRDGLQVDAFSQECGLFNNMVECGSDVKETTLVVDDRLNDQG